MTTIPREIPVKPAPLRAWMRRTADGGAMVTIGAIASPFAKFEVAAEQLRAMARDGKVTLEPGAIPC